MRWIAAVVVAAVAMIGLSVPADAAPDTPDTTAHVMSSADITAICMVMRDSGWTLTWRRHIHYGPSNIVQCQYHLVLPLNQGTVFACRQYVFGPGVPNPHEESYPPQSGPSPKCW